MLYPNFAVYVGERNRQWQGYIAKLDFFIVLKAEGLSKDAIMEFLENLDKEVPLRNFEKLEDFDVFISNIVKEKNLPVRLSLSAGFLKDSILFLKTIEGYVYLGRGESFAKIIDKSKSAAGHIKEGDSFIFCTDEFAEGFGEEKLGRLAQIKDIKKITDEITTQDKAQNGAAIFANFEEKILPEEKIEEPVFPEENLKKAQSFKKNIKFDAKKVTFLLAILFILFFASSLVLNKTSDSDAKKQEILGQLEQAEEVSKLNIETATELVADSERDFLKLKKTTFNKKTLTDIENAIAAQKKKIFKSVEKDAVEFFDLRVEDKKAKGTVIYLFEELLYILNPEGVIYEVSLTKKSIDKQVDSKIKNAESLSAYEDTIYFFKSDAVYSLESGKSKKAISKDDLWKRISQLRAYAGNLYLLDQKAGNIFKYTSTEKGFSEGSIYIRKDPSVNIPDPVSMAIDGSVYIATEDYILKFTNGYRDAFSFYIPEEIKIFKIYTDENLDFLYVWDKEKGKIYILSKDGTYQKQVKSSVLKNSQDFVVFGNNAFIFSSPKIYKLALN